MQTSRQADPVLPGLDVCCIRDQTHLSNDKNLGWLGYIGDYTTQLYRDYNIINHYKDPYEPTSIMESQRVFFVAHLTS